MTTTRRRFSFTLPLLIALAPLPGMAADGDNAKNRIRAAGRLIALSQTIPAAACHVASGIEAKTAQAQLASARAEFDRTLAALEFGDADLNIQQPETRRKTLHELRELQALWAPVAVMTKNAAAGTDLSALLDGSAGLYAATEDLVPELIEQYANPFEATYSELHQIKIAGRQVMLTRKITKLACVMGTSLRTEETATELQSTIQIFEASLDALRFGMPALGLQPPPNAAVSEGLEEVRANWFAAKPLLEDVLAGEEIGEARASERTQRLDATATVMGRVAEIYANGVQPGS